MPPLTKMSPSLSSPSTEAPGRIWGSRTGWLTGIDSTEKLLVDFPGNTAGSVVARLAVAVDARSLRTAVSTHQGVVLLFDEGDPRLPVIMGFIQEALPTPLVDAILEEQSQVPSSPQVDAKVDGRRVTITGKDEIVLQCGEASITLRRNGKVVVKGTYLESRATGTHCIRGGSVEIN